MRSGPLSHRAQLRSLVDTLEVVRVLPHVIEGAGRGVRVVEGRNTSLVENLHAGLNVVSAHPTGQYRLAPALGEGAKLFGNLCRVGHALRGQHDQHAIDAGSLAAISSAFT